MSQKNRMEMSFSDDDAEEDFSVNHTDLDDILDDKPIVISSDESEEEEDNDEARAHPTEESLSGLSPLILSALIGNLTLKVNLKKIKRHDGIELQNMIIPEQSKEPESSPGPTPSRLSLKKKRRNSSVPADAMRRRGGGLEEFNDDQEDLQSSLLMAKSINLSNDTDLEVPGFSYCREAAENPESGSKDDEGFVDTSFQAPVSQSTPVINQPTSESCSTSKSKQISKSTSSLKRSRLEIMDPESSEEEVPPLSELLSRKKKLRRNETSSRKPPKRISIFDVDGEEDEVLPQMRDPDSRTVTSSPDLLMSFATPKKVIVKKFNIKVKQRENFDKYPNVLKQLRRIMKKKRLDDVADDRFGDDFIRKKKDQVPRVGNHFKQKKATSKKFPDKHNRLNSITDSNSKTVQPVTSELDPNDDYSFDSQEDYVVTVSSETSSKSSLKFGEIINEAINEDEVSNEGNNVAINTIMNNVNLGNEGNNINQLVEGIDNFVTLLVSQSQNQEMHEDDSVSINQEVHQDETDDIFKEMEAMHAESQSVHEIELFKKPTMSVPSTASNSSQVKQSFKIPKLKGTAEELKKSRSMPTQIVNDAKERLSKRIEEEEKKIEFKMPDGRSNEREDGYSEDELADKNDEGWKELHDLESESERIRYFRKKFDNFEANRPSINLSFHGYKRNCRFNKDEEGLNDCRSHFENRFQVDKESEKFEDNMSLIEFYARNKDHIVQTFKDQEADPSRDTILLMAHYLKHFTVSSGENIEFWEFYFNNKEIPKEQLCLATSTENHVAQYNPVYGGGDELFCAGCGRSHVYRIPSGT